MHIVVMALILTCSWLVTAANPALAVPLHLHCLHTPGTVTAIAGGVTANAPQSAFDTFHMDVHLGAFANNSPSSPVFITTTTPAGSCG